MPTPERRILLVEDNEDTRELLLVVLEGCGYELKAAATWAEGLEFALGERFDLYLLDNRLPDGRGVELCRHIRAFDQHTPVLFISAAAREADQQEALGAGAQDYLTKPVDLDQLDEAITRLLQGEHFERPSE